jgi:YgiT-type zinc finger domain-containing protein
MLEQENPEFCDLCGARGVEIRRVAKTFGKGDDLLVIDQVPVIHCPNCGKNYLTAEVLRQIELIKAGRREKF